MEVWKDIPEFENAYKVSNTGKIVNKATGFIRKIIKDKNGYSVVKLAENKRYKTVKLHRVLAQVFIPNPLNLPQVLHNDDDVSNNDLSNLRWGTIRDNMFDKNLRKRHCMGERHSMSKLTDEQRELIGQLVFEGHTLKALSERFNISPSIIYRIKKRKLNCK